MHFRYLFIGQQSIHGRRPFNFSNCRLKHIHLSSSPLHFLHDIQTTMHNELVHMPGLFRKPRNAITALFRRAKFVFEKRVIERSNYAEIVWHFVFGWKLHDVAVVLKVSLVGRDYWGRLHDILAKCTAASFSQQPTPARSSSNPNKHNNVWSL